MFRVPSSIPPEEAAPPSSAQNAAATTLKKKRRPAGTPDPDAEVVSLSPRTLLSSERYVCDICEQGFQREQNLQMHRRRHKQVPWKLLLQRRDASAGAGANAASAAGRKRVFVCPEASCLHHDPCHALGDLVGIKKHFRRKHSAHRQWACHRCSKAYAVHSDYKAHAKTCGTRGHSCDCGRVFSRVETFIEHQDSCTASSPIPNPPPPPLPISTQPQPNRSNIRLPLLPPADNLHLSIAPPPSHSPSPSPSRATTTMTMTMTTKAAADSAREEAMQQVLMAERELAAARRMRQQARAELDKACALRSAAARQINGILLQITCGDCRERMVRRRDAAQGVIRLDFD